MPYTSRDRTRYIVTRSLRGVYDVSFVYLGETVEGPTWNRQLSEFHWKIRAGSAVVSTIRSHSDSYQIFDRMIEADRAVSELMAIQGVLES